MNKRKSKKGGKKGIRQAHFGDWDGNKGGHDAAWVWEAWIPAHYHWGVGVAQDRLPVAVDGACIAGLQVEMIKYSAEKKTVENHIRGIPPIGGGPWAYIGWPLCDI